MHAIDKRCRKVDLTKAWLLRLLNGSLLLHQGSRVLRHGCGRSRKHIGGGVLGRLPGNWRKGRCRRIRNRGNCCGLRLGRRKTTDSHGLTWDWRLDNLYRRAAGIDAVRLTHIPNAAPGKKQRGSRKPKEQSFLRTAGGGSLWRGFKRVVQHSPAEGFVVGVRLRFHGRNEMRFSWLRGRSRDGRNIRGDCWG